ncbi:MAG: DNA-3-methyladenine glycosylase family protein [Devosia sp.]
MTERLDSAEALARHLAGLLERDARLAAVAERAGPFDIRQTEPGFAGLAKIICGQQLSVASARAIWGRFEALPGALEPQSYLRLTEAEVRAAGFSAGKYRTVRATAEAIASGEIDLGAIAAIPALDAVKTLVQIKGIGPWTAEIYLMFCAGHPDIFPAGDLALQKAVGQALGLDERPDIRELIAIAQAWAPYRATAALLFWRYYAVIRDKEGIAP